MQCTKSVAELVHSIQFGFFMRLVQRVLETLLLATPLTTPFGAGP